MNENGKRRRGRVSFIFQGKGGRVTHTLFDTHPIATMKVEADGVPSRETTGMESIFEEAG